MSRKELLPLACELQLGGAHGLACGANGAAHKGVHLRLGLCAAVVVVVHDSCVLVCMAGCGVKGCERLGQFCRWPQRAKARGEATCKQLPANGLKFTLQVVVAVVQTAHEAQHPPVWRGRRFVTAFRIDEIDCKPRRRGLMRGPQTSIA